jgi:hypothetical protein
MPTPAFTPFVDAQTAYKSPLGQDFFRQMQDDFTNLNSRLSSLESAIAVYDHFNTRVAFSRDGAEIRFPSFPVVAPYDVAASPTFQASLSGNWVALADTDDTLFDISGGMNVPPPAFSVARIGAASGGSWMSVFSRRTVLFNSMTRPLVLNARFKLSADIATKAGLRVMPTAGASAPADPSATDSKGIWLERVDATNWRFVSFDSSRNNGSSFAKPTPGTWYTVQIIFTDDPSNRALCYVNGVLKETFTSNLPTADELSFYFGHAATGGTMDIDIASLRAEGIADAA